MRLLAPFSGGFAAGHPNDFSCSGTAPTTTNAPWTWCCPGGVVSSAGAKRRTEFILTGGSARQRPARGSEREHRLPIGKGTTPAPSYRSSESQPAHVRRADPPLTGPLGASAFVISGCRRASLIHLRTAQAVDSRIRHIYWLPGMVALRPKRTHGKGPMTDDRPTPQQISASLDRVMAAFRKLGQDVRDGLSRMIVRVDGDHIVMLTVGGRYLRTPLSARDRFGYPVPIVRNVAPTPLYTRHTLGDHEAARDTRHIRCRAPVIYRCDPPAICAASTAAGGRCARPVTAPGRRCRLHGGAS